MEAYDNLSATFGDAEVVNTSLNAIQIVARGTDDINNEFNMKRRMYENSEAFFSNMGDSENSDADILELRTTVLKGQRMLRGEILKYSSLKAQIDLTTKLNDDFHEHIVQMKRSLLFMDQLEITHQHYKADIDALHKQLDAFDCKIKDHIELQMVDTKKEYETSFTKLVQLKSVYQVLRDSDISFVCPICLNAHVDSFLVPCGHTFCKECIRTNVERCHMCRHTFNKIGNLYYS